MIDVISLMLYHWCSESLVFYT